MTPRDQCMPLAPAREHYASAVMVNAENVPREQPAESATDGVVMISLLQHADRVFSGGFVLNAQDNTAEQSVVSAVAMGRGTSREQDARCPNDGEKQRGHFCSPAKMRS